MPDENILKLKEYYNSTFCRIEKSTPFFCKNAKERWTAREQQHSAKECIFPQRIRGYGPLQAAFMEHYA
jgi:hypothetical protein